MGLPIYYDIYPCKGDTCLGQLLLIHGWGMNSLVWDDLIPLLNDDYEIYIVDLPGLGRSPISQDDYNLESMLEQILTIASPRSIWVGWSLGGLVVQLAALNYPERIEQAYMISSTPKFVSDDVWPGMSKNIFQQFQDYLQEDWEGTLIRFLTLQCKGSETIKEDTKKLREYLFYYGLPATKALRDGLVILGDTDLRKGLTTVHIPLHFIFGEFDALIPKIVFSHIEELNPLIKTYHVKGASHASHISHPQKIKAIIENNQDHDIKASL